MGSKAPDVATSVKKRCYNPTNRSIRLFSGANDHVNVFDVGKVPELVTSILYLEIRSLRIEEWFSLTVP